MPRSDIESPLKDFEASLEEGMLGDEYELVGVYNEEAEGDDDSEFEIFIVAAGSEA